MLQAVLTLGFAASLLLLGGQNGWENSRNSHEQELRSFHKPARKPLTARMWTDEEIVGTQLSRRTPGSKYPRTTLQCLVDNDLIIALDSSTNLNSDDFKKAKTFVSQVADAFTSQQHNRLAFDIFATEPQVIFDLTNSETPSQLRSQILTAPYFGTSGQQANFHYTLQDAYTELVKYNRSNVNQNFLIITGGKSTEPEQISPAAQQMIGAGVRNFVVGIGSNVQDNQLLDVVGGQSDNVIVAQDYDSLGNIVDQVIQAVCGDVPPTCHKTNDLIVVLDDSGSMDLEKFNYLRTFAAKILDSFSVSSKTRVSLHLLGSTDKSVFTLDNTLTKAQIQDEIYSIAPRFSGTRTDLSLDAATDEFKTLGGSARKNLLIITDGSSTDPAQTKVAAARTLAAGINTYIVGVDGDFERDEALIITGQKADRVFQVKQFDEVQQLLQNVTIPICQ